MSNLATPVTNAVFVNLEGYYDGVFWFNSFVDDLTYSVYAKMPKIVRYKGMNCVKVGFNTDHNTVSYKQSDAVAFGA